MLIKTAPFLSTKVLSKRGFTTLCLDAEYASFNRDDLDTCILATQANWQQVLTRIPNDHHNTILHALDLGADGILIKAITAELIQGLSGWH